MTWLIDLGNTRAKWSRFAHGQRAGAVAALVFKGLNRDDP